MAAADYEVVTWPSMKARLDQKNTGNLLNVYNSLTNFLKWWYGCTDDTLICHVVKFYDEFTLVATYIIKKRQKPATT